MKNSEKLENWTEKEREAKRLASHIKPDDAFRGVLREAEIVLLEIAA